MAENTKPDGHKIYRISIFEDQFHEQLWERKFTTTTLWITAAVTVLATILIIYALVAFTPLRKTIPGYPDSRTRNEAVQNAIKIDSLENIVNRWEFYAENLKRVVNGQEPLNIDSLFLRKQTSAAEVDAAALAKSDSLLRKTVTEAEQFELSGKTHKMPAEGKHFFTPLKGTVSQTYDPVLHPYIDITAPAGSVVMSILDGTVIFTGLTEDAGYCIQVQHEGDLISVYKHNQKVLHTAGDKISAGAPIALVGNSGISDAGDHLHFELWYDGEAVDPTQYISF